MNRPSLLLLVLVATLALPLMSQEKQTAKEPKRPMFLPPPLADEWTKWIVGEWEGSGQSDTGHGKGIERFELALSGQFLISRGEAKITKMTPEQISYLKKNMHASDAQIERFQREGYQSMEIYTIDQSTGEVVGYLFDSLRCTAKGRGKRQGNKEIVEWEWSTGHKSTRITEKVSEDRMVITQRTPMPDGSVMEEKGESTRRK
jgi:hypothetical protein